jgi:tetratricopeptide (TPR) repeat protein
MMTRIATTVLTVMLAAGTVRAEDCPSEIPEDTAQRRALAKQWFSTGESATKGGNDVAALKAYQCSLKFVQHGFTAFNIAQLAEKVGDLELAISSYTQYLLLVPEATDGKDVAERIEVLKARLAEARQREKDLAAARTREQSSTEVEPPPASGTARTRRSTVGSKQTGRGSDEDADVVAETSGVPKYRTAGWITMGSGGAVVVAGVISNLLARSKMSTCRSKYSVNDRPGAESACSDAKPLAYLSYVAFGVGTAAIVAGSVLAFYPMGTGDVALGPLPEGGFSLRYAGRF